MAPATTSPSGQAREIARVSVEILVVLVALSGLAGFAAWGLPGVNTTQLRPFAPHGANGVLAASLLAFLSFGGFDMVAAAGEEVQRPEQNLPRAILLTWPPCSGCT
jgi:APA family basic amino acid/polyamine antiporter